MYGMTRHTMILGLGALALLVVAAPAAAQESGADVWARTCARCHRMQPPNKYDADSWRAIVGHMALNARLTSDEEEAVLEFLMGAARRLTMERPEDDPVRVASADPGFLPLTPPSGQEIYTKYCVACHGATGEGDGPAAAALTPRPSDLTDPERMSQVSDEELLAIIAEGRGTMPGFSTQLSDEQISALLEFVRAMSEKKGN